MCHLPPILCCFPAWPTCVHGLIWRSLRTPHRATESWVLTDVSMATRHWTGRGEVRSVLCLEWRLRSRSLSHGSVRNGSWSHLWNPPPTASANTVQPTGAGNICMRCTLYSTGNETQPQDTLSYPDSLLVSPISFWSICPHACRTEELVIRWRWKPKRVIYFIPQEKELNSPTRCLFTLM